MYIIPDTHCWHLETGGRVNDRSATVHVCCHCGGKRHWYADMSTDPPEGHGPHFISHGEEYSHNEITEYLGCTRTCKENPRADMRTIPL